MGKQWGRERDLHRRKPREKASWTELLPQESSCTIQTRKEGTCVDGEGVEGVRYLYVSSFLLGYTIFLEMPQLGVREEGRLPLCLALAPDVFHRPV